MTEQLPEQIRRALESTAAAADVPHLPLHHVLDRGHDVVRVRRRRTAIWTAVAAAVVVLTVSLPLALAGHGARQAPAPTRHLHAPSPSPDGGPTHGPTNGPDTAPDSGPARLAYVAGHQLHADGRTIATKATALLSRGGSTYVSTYGAGGSVTYHLRHGRLEQVSQPAMTGDQPWRGWHDEKLSPDGSVLVVVTYPDQNTARLIAYRTSDDTEIAHRDIAEPFMNWTGGGNSLTLLGIDARGRVFWVQEHIGATKGPQTDWVWRPGHGDPTELGDPFSSQLYGIFTVTPAGPVVGGSILDEDAAGSWRPVTRLADPHDGSQATVWSASGSAYARGGVSPAFVSTSSHTRIAADLPGQLSRWLGFESETDVLGAVKHGDTAELVRCDATTGNCTAIETLPRTWTTWRWAINGSGAVPPPSSDSPPEPSRDAGGITTITTIATIPLAAHDVGPLAVGDHDVVVAPVSPDRDHHWNTVDVIHVRTHAVDELAHSDWPDGLINWVATTGDWVAWVDQSAEQGDSGMDVRWQIQARNLPTGATRTLASSGSEPNPFVPVVKAEDGWFFWTEPEADRSAREMVWQPGSDAPHALLRHTEMTPGSASIADGGLIYLGNNGRGLSGHTVGGDCWEVPLTGGAPRVLTHTALAMACAARGDQLVWSEHIDPTTPTPPADGIYDDPYSLWGLRLSGQGTPVRLHEGYSGTYQPRVTDHALVWEDQSDKAFVTDLGDPADPIPLSTKVPRRIAAGADDTVAYTTTSAGHTVLTVVRLP